MCGTCLWIAKALLDFFSRYNCHPGVLMFVALYVQSFSWKPISGFRAYFGTDGIKIPRLLPDFQIYKFLFFQYPDLNSQP